MVVSIWLTDFKNDLFMHIVILNLQSHFDVFKVCV
jgi:hypothetical protein